MPTGVPYVPTDEQRRLVKAMAGYGVPHEGIAIMLEIDPKTLRRHYRGELDRGSVEATAKVAQSLFQMATVEKSVAAAIFWMKARAGWREKQEVQVQVDARPVQQLTDQELENMIRYYEREIAESEEEAKSLALEGSAEPGSDGGT